MNSDSKQNDLVTFATKSTAFEADALVVVLRDAGIDAFAFTAPHSLAFGEHYAPVPVQVRRADLERAQEIIERNRQDSVDIDWDDAELGERDDSLPLTTPGRTPVPAWIGLGIATLLLLTFVLAVLYGLGVLP